MEEQVQQPQEEQKPARKPRKKETKPRKKKRPHYATFEEAKKIVRNELITSRTKYEEWWQRERPKTISRFPYRVYRTEWLGWNDFLGTDNQWSSPIKKHRPFDEAVMWAHTLRLASQPEWMEFVKQGKCPEDIPHRPDLTYKSWVSWPHFLGSRIKEAIEAKQQSAPRTRLFYIIRQKGVPLNVFTFGVEDTGITTFIEKQQKDLFDVIQVFWFDPKEGEKVKQVVDGYSTPYYGDERQKIVPNVYNIVWALQSILETYSPRSVPVEP